jgi:DNA-binding transcriptional ArsR family regulator
MPLATAASATLLAPMDQPMDDIFKALADPGRRRLLDSLNARNGQNLNDLCAVMDMTRQSVTKHLEILEAANLVVVIRRGRERLHYLNAAPIHDVSERWIGQYHHERVRALADLKDALELTTMTTSTHTTTQSFVYTTYIKTTAEQLWNALTTPAFTKRYWDMEFVTDWAPGSHMTWKHKDVVLDDPAQVVIEATPFTRLSYTWHTMTPEFAEHVGIDAVTIAELTDETRRQRSKATFEIEDMDGKCKLTVIHDDFPEGSTMLRMVSTGWPAVISSLKTLLETGHHIDDPV